MKKVNVLLAVFPVLMALTGCGLAIPKAIEVRAAPGIDVGVKIDLTDKIKDPIKDSSLDYFGKITFTKSNDEKKNMVLVACKEVSEIKKGDLYTAVNNVIKDMYVTVGITSIKISAALSNAGFSAGITESNVNNILGMENDLSVGQYVIAVLNTKVSQQELPYTIDNIEYTITDENMGDFLKGFKIKGAAGELYIADYAPDSQFSDFIGYNYGVNLAPNVAPTKGEMKKMPDDYRSFDWNDESKFFDPAPPADPNKKGQSITNLFVDNSLKAEFKIVMLKEATIKELLTCLKDVDLKAEMIAWIPFAFEVGNDSAFFNIPINEMLGDGDLFKRKEGAKDTMVKEMSIAISFSEEAFNKMFDGKYVVIENTDSQFESKYKLEKEKVEINFDKEDMKKINDLSNNPFKPSIKILFNQKDELFIPWELKTASVTLKAEVAVRVEL